VAAVLAAALLACPPPSAQATGEEQRVVVSATRGERSSLEVPVSIDLVDGEALREGQPKVNLSESLGRVPGLMVQNRQNYAQDLQLSIRGFGARSTFGIRGVKLYADGIPATMPDGQGQAANFSLSSARRIEVMRGPIASLYGNSSGGVVQVFTEDGPARPTVTAEAMQGTYGTRRFGVQAGGQFGAFNVIGDGSHFHTDGYRAHSSADRDQFNGKLTWQAGDATTLTAVVNALDQPETQDPLGLTRSQVAADPRQADASTSTFNTRKSIRHEQIGLTVAHRLDGANRLRASAFFGDRQVRQFQALSGSAITSAGGVVDLDRYFGGLSLNWLHEGTWLHRPLSTTVGLEQEMMHERRRGFVNNAGAMGDLRRDEDDRVESTNVFAQADWRFADRASATLGVRTTRVRFDSRDHFVVAVNPDDSGRATFSNTIPVAGLNYRLTPEFSLYTSAGGGFETPTFAELAYRTNGPGLNFALKPSRSSSTEVGLKGRIAGYQRVTLARFDTATRDEIVIDTAIGGRTTFKNASRTRRLGWEASWQALLPAGFDAHVAYTMIDARFDEAYASGAPAIAVPAGNRIPGIPRTSLYAQLQWHHDASGFAAAIEVRRNDRVYVDDQNSDSASACAVANLRAGFEQKASGWRITETLRVDNIGNRNYVGSVIVADGNGRFFEPAPRRALAVIVSGRLAF
jgi:iron complex outermembrane receptor protein